MKKINFDVFLSKARNLLLKIDLKIFLSALAVLVVIVFLIITTQNYSRYGTVKKDGLYYIDIESIARDYGIDLSETDIDFYDYYTENGDNNFSYDLSKSLYLTNLYLEENGVTDSELRGKILANIVLAFQEQVSGKKYSLENLNIIRSEDINNITDYYLEINQALETYLEESAKENIDILGKYPDETPVDNVFLSKIETETKSSIQKNIYITKNFIEKLISIPATEKGAEYQLKLINLFSKQEAFFQALHDIDTDPAKYVLLEEDFIENFQTELVSHLEDFYYYFNSFNIEIN